MPAKNHQTKYILPLLLTNWIEKTFFGHFCEKNLFRLFVQKKVGFVRFFSFFAFFAQIFQLKTFLFWHFFNFFFSHYWWSIKPVVTDYFKYAYVPHYMGSRIGDPDEFQGEKLLFIWKELHFKYRLTRNNLTITTLVIL